MWKFFKEIIPAPTYSTESSTFQCKSKVHLRYRCQLCNNNVSSSGNTTNLTWHLKRYHLTEYEKAQRIPTTETTSSDTETEVEEQNAPNNKKVDENQKLIRGNPTISGQQSNDSQDKVAEAEQTHVST